MDCLAMLSDRESCNSNQSCSEKLQSHRASLPSPSPTAPHSRTRHHKSASRDPKKNVRPRARIGAPNNVGIEHQLIDGWIRYPVPL
jgi:hypothetical protein